MKTLLTMCVSILFVSCSLFPPCDPIYDIPLPLDKSIEGIGKYICEHVKYKSEPSGDYWQSPNETYNWGTGDCEDFCILDMYLIKQTTGKLPRLAIGKCGDGTHCWIELDGVQYEPQDENRDLTNASLYTVRFFMDYYSVMQKSTDWGTK